MSAVFGVVADSWPAAALMVVDQLDRWCQTRTFMNGLKYTPDVQEKVTKKIDAGASPSTEEESAILREMHTLAYDMNEPDWRRMPRIVAMLGTLTASLSIKADKIQRCMVALTVAIGVMTLVLLVGTLILIRIASHTDDQIRQIYEIAETQRHHNEKTDSGTPKIDGISR